MPKKWGFRVFENNKKNFVNKNLIKIAINLFSKIDEKDELVFVCLGCQGFIFDKLAVLVADLLKHTYNIPYYVYGGSNANITKSNLKVYLEMIKQKHSGHKIVVVDSALSTSENVGLVKVYGCGTVAGGAFDSNGDVVGDYSIIGIVGSKDSLLTRLLLTDRNFIDDMAKTIAGGINEFVKLRKYFQVVV